MNVLVIGSVPPPTDGRRASLLSRVLAFREEGHRVEILALDPLSAAHRYLGAPGIAGALEAGLAARRADAVVVQLEPGLPVRAGAPRLERTACLLALARGLRRARQVTLRLDALDDMPGGPGGRAALELWRSAGHIEVGDEVARAALVSLLGPEGPEVTVVEGAWVSPVPALGRGPGVLSVPPISLPEVQAEPDAALPDAIALTTLVRSRAAAARASLAERAPDSAAAQGTVPLWQWLPWPGAGVPSMRWPGASGSGAPGAGRSLRRAVLPVLAAAERRPATRPLAAIARAGWRRLRAAIRP